MATAFENMHRVASEARPPAVWGRVGYDGWDDEFLLSDLVDSHAWLERELKEWFLANWVNNDDFYIDPDLEDPMIERTHNDMKAFAAMDPVVDLDSLRGRDPMAA